MRGENWSSKILVGGKEVFIGIDVHKENWHVTVRVEEEEVFHGGVSQANIMPCEGFLITSRIVRSKLPMKQVPAVSGYMISLPKMA